MAHARILFCSDPVQSAAYFPEWKLAFKSQIMKLPPFILDGYVMRESNWNLDIPPRAYPREFGFWRFGQVKFPTYICNSRSNTPRIVKNWSSNPPLGITKFFFPSETLFNRSEPFSFSQPRTKLISSHLNSPSSLVPFWIQHTCLKEKFKFPTPSANSPPSTRKKGQIPAFFKYQTSKFPRYDRGGDVKVSIWFTHKYPKHYYIFIHVFELKSS
jgi:hypothetical protein